MVRYLRKNFRELATTAVLAGVLLFGLPFLERSLSDGPLPPPSGKMSLYVFDVGQGDAILAEEGTNQILIDGGPDDSVLAKLGQAMPAGDRTIELVVISHPHADHITGLKAVLNNYEVEKILMTDAAVGSAVYRDLLKTISEKNILVDNPAVTAKETIGAMEFTVLHYENENEVIGKHRGSDDGLNDSSIVGMLAYQGKKFLLMGDATTAVEDELLAANALLKADFIKIGHHGSAYSTSETFLSFVDPHYAAISLGARNPYGFPAWRITELLKKLGVACFRTDTGSDITATADAASLQVTATKVK